jgi:hypothetical protein
MENLKNVNKPQAEQSEESVRTMPPWQEAGPQGGTSTGRQESLRDRNVMINLPHLE